VELRRPSSNTQKAQGPPTDCFRDRDNVDHIHPALATFYVQKIRRPES
jgi:hypothetical protein